VIELLLFATCCLMAVAGAIGGALVKNLFHGALLLGLSLVGTAGLYLFLEQTYLACLQIIVYVGGVLVLILFATLFSADIMGAVQKTPLWLRALGFAGAALAAVLAVQLAWFVVGGGRELLAQRAERPRANDPIDGTSGAIGDLLVGPWLVPFLLAGFLLTIALVGAVATVRRFRRPAVAEVHHG
jgi:NADH:ubiquinone oxidoreductase subunit 6 (subunit J)